MKNRKEVDDMIRIINQGNHSDLTKGTAYIRNLIVQSPVTSA